MEKEHNGEGRGFSFWDIVDIYKPLFSEMTPEEYAQAVGPNNRPYMDDGKAD